VFAGTLFIGKIERQFLHGISKAYVIRMELVLCPAALV